MPLIALVNGNMVIASGLNEGEQVVTTGAAYLVKVVLPNRALGRCKGASMKIPELAIKTTLRPLWLCHFVCRRCGGFFTMPRSRGSAL